MMVLIYTYILIEIILCAQPDLHQRSHQLDSLKAAGLTSYGVTLACLARGVWCGVATGTILSRQHSSAGQTSELCAVHSLPATPKCGLSVFSI